MSIIWPGCNTNNNYLKIIQNGGRIFTINIFSRIKYQHGKFKFNSFLSRLYNDIVPTETKIANLELIMDLFTSNYIYIQIFL